MVRPDESLSLFGLCRSTDWHVLPEPGGWLDQPDWFLHDAAIISQRMSYLRRREKRAKKAQERLAKMER